MFLDINIVSSANRETFEFAMTGISLVNRLKNDGESHEPCGRPAVIILLFDFLPSILTVKNLFVRKDSTIFII